MTYLYCKFESLASLEKVVRDKNIEIESALIIWK